MSEVNLHDLPERWTWTSLENCVDVLDSQRIPINAKERETRKGEIPYYGATGQVGWIDDYIFDEELVLLGEDGAPFLDPIKNKSYIIKGKSWVNNHAHVLRALNGISLNRFINHYLNNFNYTGYVTGTTRLKLNQAPMRKIPIPLAPLPEQHRIVSRIDELFSRLDAGVAALRRARAQLQRYRQSVLQAAVEGRLTAEWRAAHQEVEPASALLNRIKKERERLGMAQCRASMPFDMSELPVLPWSWEWARAEQLSDFITKGTTPRSDKLLYGSGEIPFIKVYNLTFEGILDFNVNPTFISMETHREDLARSLVLPGDILINIVGPPLGKVSIVPDIYPEWNINQAIARFRPVSGYNRNFLSIALRTDFLLGWSKHRSKATAGQFNLTLEICRELPLPVPPVAEQNEIVFKVEQHISAANDFDDIIEASIKRANRLRQSILKSAFEGRLVPQDPNDEPASLLLERIRAEKAKQSPPRGRRRSINQASLIQ